MSADRMFAEEANYVWLKILGIPIRTADLRVIDLLGGGSRATADYIWDHWLGEPSSPSRAEVFQLVVRARKAFIKEVYPDKNEERSHGSTRATDANGGRIDDVLPGNGDGDAGGATDPD